MIYPSIRVGIIGVLSLLSVMIITGISEPVAQAQQNSSSAVGMIKKIFGAYAPGAIHVANCESHLNTWAYNAQSVWGSHSAGIFQILYPSTWRSTSQSTHSPYNAWANIVAAHEIFVRDGHSWREWVCKPWRIPG